MLTLERKEKGIVSIEHKGEVLEVHVSLIKNNKVKLSFDGPESFEIWRDEVYESDSTAV